MLGLERQTPQRIDERAAPPAGDDAHRHWDEGRAIGSRSRFVDGAAGQRRHRGDGVDIGGLALIGRHAERGVALEMLDGDIALARGERDVFQRHIVLEIDPAPAFVIGLGPGGLDSVGAGRRVRRGAFTAAGLMALAQGLGEREGAVGGAGDGEVLDSAHGRRARPASRHSAGVRAPGRKDARSATIRRRAAARRNRAFARRRAPLRRRGADDAFDRGAARHSAAGMRGRGACVDKLDLRARLGQGFGDGIGAVVVGRDDHALADKDARSA